MASIAGSSLAMQPRHNRVSRLKLGRPGRSSSLSFSLRPMPARLRISCAAKPETVEKVCAMVRKQFSLPDETPITGESKFTQLGADSLDTVELVMAVEEEFAITVDENSAQSINTVHDVAELIDKLCNEKSG